MKILITGATGFAGSYLTEYLTNTKSNQVYGTYLFDNTLKELDDLKNKVKFIKLDLLDKKAVKKIIAQFKPEEIYHLAALTSPAASFIAPQETISNNILAQINLLETIREVKSKAKILIIGSADEYGLVDQKVVPIKEITPFNPTTPYSVSKITQDLLGLQYFNSYKLNIYRARPFNHIGPRQTDGFVVASFCKQIAQIERNQTEAVIKVGALSPVRDFTDVRDMVIAYDLLLKKGKPGVVYNIGSGKGYKISEILEKLLSFAKKKIKIEIETRLFRPVENPVVIADVNLFKKTTGWMPKIPLEKTLRDTLEYWRNKTRI